MRTLTARLYVAAVLGLALLLAACGGDSGGASQTPPGGTPSPPAEPQIALQPDFSQLAFDAPVAMVQAPRDPTRWYIVERQGVVRVFDNDANVAVSDIFIDISSKVDSSFSEAGLLGIAFHPDFPNTPEVFLSYTSTGSILIGFPLISNVSRFVSRDGGATLDPASESPVMMISQDFSNHNGGHIVFGPDGMLYAGWGDGGDAGDPLNRAQDTGNMLGTITRIDVDGADPYAVPADNPFSGSAICQDGFAVVNANCPEIFAWGFRNPWRFSFDRLNGDLWVGDVGQDDWEEIDRVERGSNYGWSVREGAHCFRPASGCDTTFVDPITEYGHTIGSSVTGGFVYRGSLIAGLQGSYVYGDFGTGRIWSILADSSQGSAGIELLATGLNISSFAESSDGELYVLDYGPGVIYKLVDAR